MGLRLRERTDSTPDPAWRHETLQLRWRVVLEKGKPPRKCRGVLAGLSSQCSCWRQTWVISASWCGGSRGARSDARQISCQEWVVSLQLLGEVLWSNWILRRSAHMCQGEGSWVWLKFGYESLSQCMDAESQGPRQIPHWWHVMWILPPMKKEYIPESNFSKWPWVIKYWANRENHTDKTALRSP